VLAALLKSILPENQRENAKKSEHVLLKLAARISENRIYAGLHYEEDNEAGKLLGEALAKHLLKRVGIPELKENTKGSDGSNPDPQHWGALPGSTAPNLAWLFHEARKELASR
jgi:hypothetical protein